jgi:hypothetical protein
MRQILVLAVCGLSLGACTSSDMFKTEKEMVSLRVESEPPGAEARVAGGSSCRTPCSLPVDASAGRVSVTYVLDGYQAQEVAVDIVNDAREPARADPNPVMAELDPAPRGTAAKRPAKKRTAPKSTAPKPAAKKPAAKKSRPAAPPAAEAAPAPAAPAPATTQSSPWPATPAPPPAQQ